MKKTLLFLFLNVMAFNYCICASKLFSATTNITTYNNIFPKDIKKLAEVEGYTEYELSNGMKVLLFSDQSKPSLVVNMVYNVGSRHEGNGEAGMAHLLEHLLFKGTPKHPEVFKELGDRGAKFNGQTTFDKTIYYEILNATDENLEWALEMEADRMVNAFVAQKDLDSEMTVVRNEFESNDNFPYVALMERVITSSYNYHGYGRAVIGNKSDIEKVPIEKLQDFYKKYYQPDNATLIVSGKIDKEKTLDLIQKYYSAIPKPSRKLFQTYTVEPTQDGEKKVTLQRVGDSQFISANYHMCAGSHPDFAPLQVLTNSLAQNPGGRLYKALVEKELATGINQMNLYLAEPGFAYLAAEMSKEKSIEEAEKEMTKVLDNLAKEPLSKEEVNRSKAELLKKVKQQFNDSGKMAIQMATYVAAGDWRLAFLHRDQLEKVTVEDVNRVAKQYFLPTNRTLGRFIPVPEMPDRAIIPEAIDINSIVTNYKGKTKTEEAEVFDASYENIAKRARYHKADNGLEICLLSKKTRGSTVNLVFSLGLGNETSLKGKRTSGALTAKLLNRGTLNFSRQAIQDQLNELGAQMNVFGSVDKATVSVQTEKQHLTKVLNIIEEVLKNPSFPKEEYDLLIQEELVNAQAYQGEPMVIGSFRINELLNQYPKDHPYYAPSIQEEMEEIKKVTLDDIKNFHQAFYGAQAGQITLVGDFEDTEILQLIKKQFGNWTAKEKYESVKLVSHPSTSKREVIETPDKSNAMFLKGVKIPISSNHKEFPALFAANQILGSGVTSRLFIKVRGTEGLSYRTLAILDANGQHAHSEWIAMAIFAPENLGKLEKVMDEEINRFISEGITQEELDKTKSTWSQQSSLNLAMDNYLSNVLHKRLQQNRKIDWDKEFEEKINRLTVEEVNAAIKKYIKTNQLVTVLAGDFSKE